MDKVVLLTDEEREWLSNFFNGTAPPTQEEFNRYVRLAELERAEIRAAWTDKERVEYEEMDARRRERDKMFWWI